MKLLGLTEETVVGAVLDKAAVFGVVEAIGYWEGLVGVGFGGVL